MSIRKYIFSLSYRRRKSNIPRLLKFLENSQYWEAKKLQEYQLKHIKKLLLHAYQNVPYYTELFDKNKIAVDNFKSFEDFKQIPFLTKKDIKERFTDLIARNHLNNECIVNYTGGSTGIPTKFYQDKSFIEWSAGVRIRGWLQVPGYNFYSSRAIIWGAERDIRSDYSLRERLYDFVVRGAVRLNCFNLSPQRIKAFLKWYNLLTPSLIIGYVSGIERFCDFVKRNNAKIHVPGAVVLCAEGATEAQRNYIESVLDAPTYNMYGGREVGLIAMECEHHRGLHTVAENNFVELSPINLSGYKNAGDLIVTNLNNYIFPFIRYKIGDIGVASPSSDCPCGRGLPLVDKIIGRSADNFVFKDGLIIAGEMFIHLMKEYNVDKYQFIQESIGLIKLKIVPNKHFRKDDIVKIKDRFSKHLPKYVELSIELIDNIPKTKTGKLRFVISRLQ